MFFKFAEELPLLIINKILQKNSEKAPDFNHGDESDLTHIVDI